MKKLFIILIFTASLFAQDVISVNTYTDSTQRDPQIVQFRNRDQFAVIWDSEEQVEKGSQSDIFLQYFNMDGTKSGSEIQVNTHTTGEQEKPAAIGNSDGRLIVVWASFTDHESLFDIKAKIYNQGEVTTEEFTVNTTTVHSQTEPDLAFISDTEFVIVWESWYQDGSNKGIYAQKYHINGTKIDDEFRVNTTTQFSQGRPSISGMKNSHYVVAWESWKQVEGSDPGYDLFAKILNDDGSTYTEEFRLNNYTENFQWYVDLCQGKDADFTAVWCSWGQDGHDGGIYMQRFADNGMPLDNEKLVNKTTQYYQWLPQIKTNSNDEYVIVWSSWKQDGSREGVYLRTFDKLMKAASLETRVNEFTDGYQWEPTFFVSNDDEIYVTYSSWIDKTKDYEVKVKKSEPLRSQGSIIDNTFEHPTGNCTADFYVHVIDSTKLTGHDYEITFNVSGEDYSLDIKDVTTNLFVVSNYELDKGEGAFYLTNVFDGIAVEFMPEFDFEIDSKKSYLDNNSGSNLQFTYGTPTGSTASLAPIDCKIVWGSSERDNEGNWVTVMDTAYSSSGRIEVLCPFTAWNITDNQFVRMFVQEKNPRNQRWDPGETITLMTPSQYDSGFPRFHAEVITNTPGGNLILPTEGDTSYVLTSRPIENEDVFRFSTIAANVTDVEDDNLAPGKYSLGQNYPNPFNPVTRINYSIHEAGKVVLEVFDIIGQKVTTLVNTQLDQGNHHVSFNASHLSSGIYIYTLKHNGKLLSRKMTLLK